MKDYYTLNEICGISGKSYEQVRHLIKLLKINPIKKEKQNIKDNFQVNFYSFYQVEQVKELIKNRDKKVIEKTIYKPLHTYINIMIIPSKLNFLTEEQL